MSDSSVIFSILAIDRASGVLGKIGGSWNKLALGVAAGGALIAAKTTEMAGNFQQQLTRLVTSAGETQSNLAVVSNGVLNLAGTVGDSTSQLNAALYTIESGGQHGAAGLTVLQAAAEGAKAENADLAVVADAVTSVLQDYHLKASDAALVTSQLVAAVGAGKTTFQEMAGALHSVLPIASSAHISLADITGAMASMTVHGMSADQASQNLADTIRHMVSPTQVQTKELAQLGINSSDLADMLGKKGLTGTLQYLSQQILAHTGPDGKVLLGIFNDSTIAAQDANTALQAMPPALQKLADKWRTGNITAGDWRTTLKGLPADQAFMISQWVDMEKRAESFSDALKTGSPIAQTYQAALAKATGDATGLNTALMLTGENTDYTNNAVHTIASTTTEAGNHVKGWAEIQKTFNQRLAQARGSAEALGIRIGLFLLPYMQKALTVVQGLVAWFSKHTTVAKVLGGAILALAAGLLLYKTYMIATAAATKVWAAMQWLLNLAMDANPIVAIIMIIVGLIAVIVYIAAKTRWFQDLWHVVWGAIKTAAEAVGSWFMNTFWHKWIYGTYEKIMGAATKAKDWIVGKWDALVAYFKSIPGQIGKLGSTLWGWLTSGFKTAVNTIVSGLNFVIDTINSVTHGLSDVWSWAGIPAIPPIPHVPKLATGGDVTQSGFVRVGERGPETVFLPAGTRVLPHGAAAGGSVRVELCAAPGDQVAELILSLLRPTVRGKYGGDVQAAAGGYR